MANRINASNLSDLLLPMRQRGNAPGVYFVRLCQWSPEIKDFLWRYHEAARAKGVIIEGQIGNPDERQLSYLTEMLGSAFEPNPAFITQALQKWMPRMSQANRVSFAQAMCDQMDELKRKGKTDSIIRNIYMKVMCWLYYKFERLMPFLGDDNPPRILYECNAVTAHELILLRILSMMGTDILLLEPQGDAAYLKQACRISRRTSATCSSSTRSSAARGAESPLSTTDYPCPARRKRRKSAVTRTARRRS